MDVFTALAVPTRRSIVELLAQNGRMQAAQISEQFSLTPSAISQHLKVLCEVKLLRVERQAQRRVYELNPAALAVVESWAKDTRQLWKGRFDYLDQLLKAEQNQT